jgi:hypothetical protein
MKSILTNKISLVSVYPARYANQLGDPRSLFWRIRPPPSARPIAAMRVYGSIPPHGPSTSLWTEPCSSVNRGQSLMSARSISVGSRNWTARASTSGSAIVWCASLLLCCWACWTGQLASLLLAPCQIRASGSRFKRKLSWFFKLEDLKITNCQLAADKVLSISLKHLKIIGCEFCWQFVPTPISAHGLIIVT